jgi:hypothetical protein
MEPSISAVSSSETPSIKRDSFVLTNERYKTPKTSMLGFHFEPQALISPKLRLQQSSVESHSVEGKDIFTVDGYFQKEEEEAMRDYSQNAKFSRSSYASHESRDQGEDPALSMNNKEKWEFFAHPPQPVNEIYKLLNFLAQGMEADISTLPWDLCDDSICASAVATNRLEKVSKLSTDLGKHQDYNTEKGMPFEIPVLYSNEKRGYESKFVNGDKGKPLLISFMLYAASKDFEPSDGMGTVYFKSNGERALRTDCKHMRCVFFEGDILHSIEDSKMPPEKKVWRVSYVFKLLFNPRKADQSMRERLHKLLTT